MALLAASVALSSPVAPVASETCENMENMKNTFLFLAISLSKRFMWRESVMTSG